MSMGARLSSIITTRNHLTDVDRRIAGWRGVESKREATQDPVASRYHPHRPEVSVRVLTGLRRLTRREVQGVGVRLARSVAGLPYDRSLRVVSDCHVEQRVVRCATNECDTGGEYDHREDGVAALHSGNARALRPEGVTV